MQKLIHEIEQLKSSDMNNLVKNKMKEFEELGKKDNDELFNELCFCLLTANFSAHGGIKIQKEIGDGFFSLSEQGLAKKLAELGHRFPNARAKFIFEARKYKDNLKEILSKINNEFLMREWLVKNIKGLGFKESSHFLRNIGCKNLAIIDFHIIDLLVRNNLIAQPKSKSLTPKKYLEIENILNQIAQKTNLSLGELDLYLWYKETGKILK
ncbi:MAG: N-glycosylase/DNA lyase [Candidatus Nanoarchaeia archaeon]|nr:N-glycosylase/DNA lyase [Candidatus Nanoarchaeia archaeon]